MVRRRGRVVDARACAAPARPSTSPSPAPSAPTSTPRWPGAPRTTRSARSTSSTGSAGPGSSSATAAARSGSWPRSTPRATRRRPATAPARCCSRRWIEASTGHLEPARRHVAAAGELADAIGDADLQARCCLLPRLRRLAPRRVGARARAHRAQPGALRRAGPALGPGRERALRRAGRDLGRRPRARRRGPRPGRALAARRRRPVAARPPRRHARRAGPRRASLRRRRPPHRPGGGDVGAARLPADRGLPAHQPRARAVPGRGLRRRGGHAGARRSRRPRRPATSASRRSARVHLGRVLRALGRTAEARAALEAAAAWHREAGGGEQAALGDCLLAALDAADRVPGAEQRLAALLEARPARRRRPGRGLRPRRARPLAAEAGDAATARELLRGRRPAHGGRLALHHRARPDRRPLAQTDGLTARRRAGAARRRPAAPP